MFRSFLSNDDYVTCLRAYLSTPSNYSYVDLFDISLICNPNHTFVYIISKKQERKEERIEEGNKDRTEEEEEGDRRRRTQQHNNNIFYFYIYI